MSECPFCDYEGPSAVEYAWNGELTSPSWVPAFVIKPLNPVVVGHRLVIPRKHVESAAEDHDLTGEVFKIAAFYASTFYESFNLITSVGMAATQTVKHLHVHIIPRSPGDDIPLPWSKKHMVEA
jgi:histidine triad (HIT) family protein